MEDSDEKFPQERRRAPRVSGAVVEYYFEDQKSSKTNAFIKDICIHGVCIYAPQNLDRNSSISLDIYLFGNENPLFAKGNVVWQKPGDYLGYNNVGIQFTEMTDADRQTLDEHIKTNYKIEDEGEEESGTTP